MKRIISPPQRINDETLRTFIVSVCDVINQRLGNIPENSAATDIEGLAEDYNKLLEALR